MIRLEGDSPNLTLTQHAGCTFGSLVVLQELEIFFSVKSKWRGFLLKKKVDMNKILMIFFVLASFKGLVRRETYEEGIKCYGECVQQVAVTQFGQ